MRKLLCILLVLVFSTMLLLPAQAATGSILYQNYDVSNNTLSCYGVSLPEGGTLSVSCGSTKMSDVVLSTIGQEQVPVTIYFLVDTATSLPADIVQQQQDILTVVSSHMRQKDTMVLSTINETFVEGRLLTDKEARQTAISTIGRTSSWKTNLSLGIENAVDSLSSSTAYNTNRFLVVLSDGHDDGLSDMDTEALRAKIQAANIPMLILVLGNGKGQASAKDLECLTQYAQASLGGTLAQLAEEKLSAAQAAESIWDAIQQSSVIRFDASALSTAADSELLVRYDIKDTRYEDTLLVRAVDLKGHITPPTAPQETTEEATEPAEEPEPNGINLLLLIGGAAVLVLIIAVVAVLLLRKPKPQPQIFPASPAQAREPAPESIAPDSPVPTVDESSLPVSTDFFAPQPFGETAPVAGGIHVYLVAILHPEITCNFILAENAESTLGRDNRASIVLTDTDRKLSGIHLGFLWDGVHLLVRDAHSTNGTYVNGVPCAGDAWYLAENGATIQAGSYDYRVTYQV